MESSDEHKSSKNISIQSAEVKPSKSEKVSKKTFFSKFKSKISSFGPGPIHQQETNNCVEKVKTKY
jgi:hypothetical protein